MRARPSTAGRLVLSLAAITLGTSVTACAATPTEEREAAETAAVTVPECTPAPSKSPGECAANEESDALLDDYITQCAFGPDAVTRDWTEDYGWIWWNPAQPGTTAAVGVEIATGKVLCT